MSATPSCAMIEPSVSSTIEWTTDWGWITTSIRSPRGLRDDGAGHDEDLLVGQRDRFSALDGREHGLERVRTRRGAQDKIDVRVRRDRDQTVASGAGDRDIAGCSHLPQSIDRVA